MTNLPKLRALAEDARRYRRLRVLGCALSNSPLLERGLVSCFTNLDAAVDADIAAYPSRGESEPTTATALLDRVDELQRECERLRASLAERNAQLGATQNAIAAECVEHVELNGHIDLAAQCRDWIAHEIIDEGDPSGRLGEFVEALGVVIDQCDRQRRRANWYEAAYTAGKQKLIESAVARATEELRAEVERWKNAHDHEAKRGDHYKKQRDGAMATMFEKSEAADAYRAMLADVLDNGTPLIRESAIWKAARDLLKHGPNVWRANDE